MTVQELIDELSKVEDKSLPVSLYVDSRDGPAYSVRVITCEEPSYPNFGKPVEVTIFSI